MITLILILIASVLGYKKGKKDAQDGEDKRPWFLLKPEFLNRKSQEVRDNMEAE